MNQIAGTRYYKWLAGFAAVALIAGLIVAPRLLPNNSGSRPRITFAQMQAQADGGLTAHWDEQTGVPDFLTGPIPYHLTSAERADPRSAAIGVLSRYRELFAMRDPARELVVTRVENDARGGQTLVRLRQVFEGLPVFGQTLLVHIDSQAIVGINGHYVPGIDVPTQAAVTAENATTAALKAAESEMPAATAPAELLVFVGDDGRANLAWKIPLKTLKPYDKLAYFIDAQKGTVLHVMPLLDGDKYRKIYDAQLKENLPGRLLAQEGEVPRDQAGAAAYQFTGQTYDYYKNTFGRDSYDDHGGTIVAIVHFPELGNSHWDGDSQVLAFGDADNYLTDKSDAFANDIVAHEMTHAVTQFSAGLVYEGQSGALNESFSDVFAVMVDREDWHLFEDNTASPPVPRPWLRDMEDPSLGGNYSRNDPLNSAGQPTTMADYANLPVKRDTDWGGVHVNSGIPNHTAYLAAQSSNREAVEQIWYRALTVYLTEKSKFGDFALALAQSAIDLYGANSREYKAVLASLQAEGLATTGGAAGPTPIPPTSAPRAPAAPTPTPAVSAGCNQLVGNGGFEGARSEPWVEITALQVPIIGADFPRTGQKSAWLGGTDEEAFQYIYQDLSLPANAKAVVLTYWHYLEEEVSGKPADATFSAVVADQQGNVLTTLESFASSKADQQWKQSTLDMSQFAGKKIRLAFAASMAPKNKSNFFVDDVAVQACTSGNPVATPPPSGAGVKVTGTITDSATGKPIAGAVIYVLKPGVTASAAAADGQISASELLSQGTTDRNGYFELRDRLARGQVYSAIVVAQGYRAIYADGGFEIKPNDADPVKLTVEMQKSF